MLSFLCCLTVCHLSLPWWLVFCAAGSWGGRVARIVFLLYTSKMTRIFLSCDSKIYFFIVFGKMMQSRVAVVLPNASTKRVLDCAMHVHSLWVSLCIRSTVVVHTTLTTWVAEHPRAFREGARALVHVWWLAAAAAGCFPRLVVVVCCSGRCAAASSLWQAFFFFVLGLGFLRVFKKNFFCEGEFSIVRPFPATAPLSTPFFARW